MQMPQSISINHHTNNITPRGLFGAQPLVLQFHSEVIFAVKKQHFTFNSPWVTVDLTQDTSSLGDRERDEKTLSLWTWLYTLYI